MDVVNKATALDNNNYDNYSLFTVRVEDQNFQRMVKNGMKSGLWQQTSCSLLQNTHCPKRAWTKINSLDLIFLPSGEDIYETLIRSQMK